MGIPFKILRTPPTEGASDPSVGPDDSTQIGSLRSKMQIYNMTETSLRHALRAASDDGINPRHHGAFVEYLRKHGFEDEADFVEGIGEASYKGMLEQLGFVKDESEKPEGEGEDGEDQIEKPVSLPTDHEIMAALLDAFEQESNICEKKRLIKWTSENGHENVSSWLENLNRCDFFKLLGSFFGNLGKHRERAPEMMSVKEGLTEEAPAGLDPAIALPEPDAVEPEADPSADPGAEPSDEPVDEPADDQAATPDAERLHPILMDMYLEGVDITRRAVLVKEMDKSSHTEEAQYVEGLSLGAFYNLLAEFFRGLGKAMGEANSTATRVNERNVEQRTWASMSHEDRVLALTDGGLDRSAATRAAGKDWERLSHSDQEAFGASLTAIAERNKPGVSRAFGRSKMNKAFTKIESPEELLPSEVREAVEMTKKLIETFGITEASKRAAGRMGKSKNMPTKLITKLEVYLGKVMKESLSEDDAPATAAPGAPSPVASAPVAAVAAIVGKKKDDDEDDSEDDDEKKAKKEAEVQTLLGKSPISDDGEPSVEPAVEPEAEKKDEPEAEKAEDDDAEKKDEPEAEKKDKDDEPKAECGDEMPAEPKDDDEKAKDAEKDAENESNSNAMSEMLRLSLGATRMQKGSQATSGRRAPSAILIGESTSGTGGAPAVGVLDVFSYGSYLEKTLPYLVAATTSRMTEDDKQKFINVFRKFVETNDLVQLTSLAGKLADSVEYCDATQEGAELTKTFRFLGDFLNMMRASVDYTKKALSQ